MKVHQKTTLYLGVLIILAGLATETFASCVIINQGPPCQEFWRADAVFVGVATRVTRVPNETGLAIGFYARQTAHISVEEAFKGIEGTAVVFDSNDCFYPFKEGERYLVYAFRNSRTKNLEVHVARTRTRPISEAAEDLAYIRGLPSAPAGSRIFGKVVEQGFKGVQMQFEPLRDVRVSLEWNDERREVVTDAEGRYEFKNVSAGSYRIRVETPAYLDYPEIKLKVNDRGCVPVDINALYQNQIGGKIVDTNGKPVYEVAVTLVSADDKPEDILSDAAGRSPGITSFSRRDGTYAFSHLRPGRYLLVINRKDFASSRSEITRGLPRLFYPGVNDLESATVIVVTNDQKPQSYDFVLPIQQ